MSHKACHWLEDLPAQHCHAGAFRVLFHLCCAHNAKAAPTEACFPSQATLREATGLSNGGLNKCLNELESAGMFWRRRTKKPSGTNGPTYYILRFDWADAPRPTPLSGVSTNSTPVSKPTPLWEPNQLHPSGEEPVREPVNEPVCSTHTHFDKFWESHPRPRNEERSRELFFAAVKGGVDPQQIVSGAQAYEAESKGNKRQYLKYSDTWLEDRRWMDFRKASKAVKAVAKQELLKLWSDAILRGQDRGRAFGVDLNQARDCVAANLVTPQQCKNVGLSI